MILIAAKMSDGSYNLIEKGFACMGHNKVVLTDPRFEIQTPGMTREEVELKAKRYALNIDWKE